MNSNAVIRSPWRAPFLRLKYLRVKPPFWTHNSCLYNNILIQLMKFSPDANKSNAFSIFIVTT